MKRLLLMPIMTLLLITFSTSFAQSTQTAQATQTMNGDYVLIALATNERVLIIAKANKKTGDVWFRRGNRWESTQTPTPIGQSNYVFKAVKFPIKGWALVRMDANSGKTWVLNAKNWIPIED